MRETFATTFSAYATRMVGDVPQRLALDLGVLLREVEAAEPLEELAMRAAAPDR